MKRVMLIGLVLSLGWLISSEHAASEPEAPSVTAQPTHATPVAAAKPVVAELPLVAERVRAERKAAWRAIMRNLRAPSELQATVREELRKHARRVARLLRVRGLAFGVHDEGTMKQVDQLLVREAAHHQAQLARLWPATPEARKQRATVKDDDQDDDKGDGDGEGEDEPEDNQP